MIELLFAGDGNVWCLVGSQLVDDAAGWLALVAWDSGAEGMRKAE